MNKDLEKIVEQIKSTMSLEELDELERKYNEMYQRLKEENETSGSNKKD